MSDNGFSFPTPPARNKVPLTANSTVTDRSTQGKGQAKPLPKVSTEAHEERQEIRPGKVPYQIGYSQMDWMSLLRKKPDMTGQGGTGFRRDITLGEVGRHNKEEDAWIVINKKVYNLTPYMKFHPGGVDIMRKVFGKDGTKYFNKYHPWVNVDALMQNCWIGILDPNAETK
ncbi:hypothetical protein BSKO_01878 [Bryopsis sp. KO-2023]|nr:hypothetical protein BSKO_01878 [Bryopsis sp. KO-2023]